MTGKDNLSEQAAELRKRAEDIALGKSPQLPESVSPEEMRQMFHDLNVHQIELEMQNEELRRTQEELDIARTRYFDLYDLAPVGYCTISEKGLVLEANLTAATLLGVPRDALDKQPFSRFILKEDQDIYYLLCKQLFKSGEPQPCELRMVKKDGSVFWAQLAASVTEDADGATVAHVVLNNVAERKQAEAALRESEERYAMTLTAVNDGLWDWHIPSGNAFFSALYYMILGYGNGEFPANYDSWRLLVHPEDIDRVEREIRSSIETGKGFAIDLRMREKNGEWLWVSTRGKAIELDAGGKALRMVGTLSDITKRKQAEDALLASKQIIEGILNAVPFSVFWKDRNLVYLGCNAMFAHDAGFADPKDLVGKDDYQMGWRDQAELYRGDDRQVIESGSAKLLIEEPQTTPDGNTITLLTSKIPLRNSNGEINGVLGTYMDITARKQAEEALLALSARQEAILASIPEIIMEVDCNKVYTWANQGGIEFFGDDVVGKDAAFYFEGEQETFGKIQPLFSGDEHVVYVESWQRRKDGEKRLLAWWCRMLKDAHGHVQGAISTARDITERKQAEAELQSKTALLEAQVNASIDGILVIDENNKRILVNQRFIALLNVSAHVLDDEDDAELLKYAVSLTRYPDKFLEKVMYLNDHVNETSRDEIEFKNGMILDRYSAPVLGRDGKYYGRIWTFRDITERKRAEAELREKEVQFRNLANSGTALVWTSGPDKLCNYFNEPWLKFTGRSLEQEIGNGWTAGVHPDDLDHCLKTYISAFDKREAFDMEYRLRHAGGEYRWLMDRGTPNYNSNGEFIGYIGHCFDITERKLAETYREMGSEILQVLIGPEELQDSIRRVLAIFKNRTGLDAVGIRLKAGDDFPYFAQQGFTDDFLLKENSLAECSADGCVCRDKDGNVCLEGTCGLVISGKTDPANSLFTPGGSFWTNDSFPMLDIPPGQDVRYHPRNQCMRQGYASIALVPIRTSDMIVGLIQLNDRRKGCFTLEMIEIIEGIASHIGEALMRKQAEETLRQSEARHSKMVANIGDVIVIIDQNGINRYKSPNIEKWFGWRPEDLVGTSAWENVHPDDLPSTKKFMISLLSEPGVAGTTECRYRCKDSTYRWIEFTGVNLMHDPDIQGILGNYHDINERKQTEEALTSSETRYRRLFESAKDGILILNANTGKIIDVNPFLIEMLGYSKEQFIEKTIWEIGFFKDIVDNQDKFLELQRKEYVRYEDLPLETADGRKINVEFVSNVYPVNHHKVIQCNIRDITIRKQAEAELIKAKEKAEESDRLKSAFLTNMSHEIRTPMNGILGFTELLKEPHLSGEEQQAYIRIIEQSGDRMLNTINDIINISKVESGQMEVFISETNVNEQIEYIYNFFKLAVEQKGLCISFKTALPAKEAVIKTDPEKIYSILTNLVKNAFKFTSAGSIEFGYEKKGRELEFFVKDTGIGIPKDKQNAIFDRFVQVDILNANAFQGAGLGLSIAKAYVEMLGGKIWVESEEGKGSAFYFTIPYNAEPGAKSAIKNVVPADENGNPIEGLKILIAEDDENSEKLIEITVKNIGREILKARTGVEAVAACRNNPDIDLILMDIAMPEMNGYEATRQIRKFNKDVIIIAQTAYALAGEREKTIEAGCNDYIAKPFKQAALMTLLKKYF